MEERQKKILSLILQQFVTLELPYNEMQGGALCQLAG
jgi:hypothetical protein